MWRPERRSFPCPMSAWLGRAVLLLGRPGGPAAPSSSSRLCSLRGPPRCCCRRRLGSLRGGADGLLPARGAPPGRALGTHPKKEPMEALNTAQGARDFIYSLHSTERSCLLRELHRFESIAIAQGERSPSRSGAGPCAPAAPGAALRAGGEQPRPGGWEGRAGLRAPLSPQLLPRRSAPCARLLTGSFQELWVAIFQNGRRNERLL